MGVKISGALGGGGHFETLHLLTHHFGIESDEQRATL